MTNKKLLQEIINKVSKNGYDFFGNCNELISCANGDIIYDDEIDSLLVCGNLLCGIILSPEFGKAFFGEVLVRYKSKIGVMGLGKNDKNLMGPVVEQIIINHGWEYHQHKMLTKIHKGKNPLKYLEKFL